MKAFQCDICGNYFPTNNGSDRENPDLYIVGKKLGSVWAYMDMCPSCIRQLNKWINGEAKFKCTEPDILEF